MGAMDFGPVGSAHPERRGQRLGLGKGTDNHDKIHACVWDERRGAHTGSAIWLGPDEAAVLARFLVDGGDAWTGYADGSPRARITARFDAGLIAIEIGLADGGKTQACHLTSAGAADLAEWLREWLTYREQQFRKAEPNPRYRKDVVGFKADLTLTTNEAEHTWAALHALVDHERTTGAVCLPDPLRPTWLDPLRAAVLELYTAMLRRDDVDADVTVEISRAQAEALGDALARHLAKFGAEGRLSSAAGIQRDALAKIEELTAR